MKIATNSPNRMDPLLVTGLFNLTGSVWLGINIQAPEPQGPGFPKQDQSVKTTMSFGSHISTMF